MHHFTVESKSMGFRGFRIGVILRVLLLQAAMLACAGLINNHQFWFSGLVLALLIVGQVIELIAYVERTNHHITQFLESIRHSDFSTSFASKGLGRSFERLTLAFNEVIREFKKNRAEKEEHFNYLQTVVQHVSIGILAFRKDGKVDMFNNAVKRLLSLNTLKDVSELERIKHGLPEILLKLRAGDSMIIKLFVGDELLQLLVRATEFRLRNEDYTLVSIQNIHAELEEKEIESWQKMIRVLTHEIMNSITPISSLAATVTEMMYDEETQQSKVNQLDKDDIDNIQDALKTIISRSQGLLSFVELYRNLTRIPKPNFRYFGVEELFNRAIRLMQPKLDETGIKISTHIEPSGLMLTADPDLVDQVLINLILNASDALKSREDARIQLNAFPNKNGRVVIEIQDNGPGIKPDIMDKIFMPFFTSKKDGSGIGLSLSRQIMHLHKGTISVKSWPDEGALFTLTF